MNKPLAIILFLFILHSSGHADEPEVKQNQKTYIQKFCGYSITLPDAWKLIGDETDECTIKPVSGLYRYIPGNKRDIANAYWANISDPIVELQIYTIRRPKDKGIGACIRDMSFTVRNLINIRDKGTSSIQNQRVQWWIGEDEENIHAYILMFNKGDTIYSVIFSGKNVPADFKTNCDEIMKTFTFLNPKS